MESTEQLVREYEQITAQIIHWDSLSWQTSNFFLAIESVFLVGAGGVLYEEMGRAGTSEIAVVILLLAGAVFNGLLCYPFWFRINRRNREFLDIRFARAREIETHPTIAMRMYTYEREEFRKPKYSGHSTSRLERHVPTLFLIAWIAVFVGGVSLTFTNNEPNCRTEPNFIYLSRRGNHFW